MPYLDQNGLPIFTTTYTGSIPLPCPPRPGEREASPVSTFPQVERAAREGARPWTVRRIDTRDSEIVDADGNLLRVSDDHGTVREIVRLVNEAGP